MNIHQSHLLAIEVLTPTTVGSDKSKEWIKGIDYIYDQKQVLCIDLKSVFQLLEPKERDTYCVQVSDVHNSKATENLNQTVKRLIDKHPAIVIRSYRLNYDPGSEPIRPVIRTGTGVPLLPGSSLKGAIRSILMTDAINSNSQFQLLKTTRDKRELNDNIFGKIAQDWMSYLQIGDAHFKDSDAGEANDLCILMAKTMNLLDEDTLGWKHELRNYSTEQFKTKGFVFPYECLRPGARSFIRFNLPTSQRLNHPTIGYGPRLEKTKGNASLMKIADARIGNGIGHLLQLINHHTVVHLQRELEWFDAFDKGDEHAANAEIYYHTLLRMCQAVQTGQEAILRVGFGVGYHSITGEYRYANHAQTGLHHNTRKPRYKSRKLLFDTKGADTDFWPMGFIRLRLAPEAELKAPVLTTTQGLAIPVEIHHEAAADNLPEIPPPTPTRTGPTPFAGKVKEGADIEATLIKADGKQKLFLLHIEGGNQEVVCSYQSDLEANSLHMVRVKQYDKKKDKIITIEYRRAII